MVCTVNFVSNPTTVEVENLLWLTWGSDNDLMKIFENSDKIFIGLKDNVIVLTATGIKLEKDLTLKCINIYYKNSFKPFSSYNGTLKFQQI